jgi:predicted Zn-dependent protease
VRFHEKGKDYDTYAYALWISLDKKLFRFVGMSLHKDIDLLKKSVDSFRSLTKSERKTIMQKYLTVVKAKDGDTLESLSKRYSNLLKMSLTAIINDKKPEDKLNKGDEVKIVLERPYKNN